MKKLLLRGLGAMMASSMIISAVGCGSSSVNSNSESLPQSSESVETSEDILQEPETLEAVSLNVAENVTSSNQQKRAFRQIGRTFVSESDDKPCVAISPVRVLPLTLSARAKSK